MLLSTIGSASYNHKEHNKEDFKMKKQVKRAFGKNVYLLGVDANGIYYWLEEGTFDCEWYWGFGYVETYANNKHPELARDIRSHQHFDNLFFNKSKCCKDAFDELFVESPFTDSEKWKILELMHSFYIARKYSDMLHMGGIPYNNKRGKRYYKK